MADGTSLPLPGTAPVRPAAKRRWPFLLLTALLCGLVTAGFWPYWRAGGQMTPPRSWLIHIHAAVFIGWMVLLLVQVLLIRGGRTDAHRRVGRVGMAVGLLVFVVGLAVVIVVPALHYARGESTLDQTAGSLLTLIGDVTLFGGFFAAAMIYRRRPEIHKRCILLATTALMFAPVSRLVHAPLQVLGLWLSPVILGAFIDWRTRGRVHPAYLIGGGVLLFGFSRTFFVDSPAWLRVGRSLVMWLRPIVERSF